MLLVESNPRAASRFAGEWIHPEGARVLESVGLLDGLDSRVQTTGFLVCPNDGLAPIRLAYPGKIKGFACEHETLVSHLRSRIAELALVDYVEGVRARPFDGTQVSLEKGGRELARVEAPLVVMAAGRSANKPEPASPNTKITISSMAGLLVEGGRLHEEGFGHVILGGPAPALAYRIDADRIRVCIDVPQGLKRGAHAAEWIWNSFAPVLPEGLREGVRNSLDRAEIGWAANAFRPRRYGTPSGIALVGDAAGVFHPLTAMGITMAVLDAEALAQSADLTEYAARRSKESYIPELLSNAIYQAFARADAGTEAIREAIFRSWRASPSHCERTMSLLGATSTGRSDFVRAFSRVALDAGADVLRNEPRVLSDLVGWLRWPWASVHPQRTAIRSRSLSWASPDTWHRTDFFRLHDAAKEKPYAH